MFIKYESVSQYIVITFTFEIKLKLIINNSSYVIVCAPVKHFVVRWDKDKCSPTSCGHCGDKSVTEGQAQCVQYTAEREMFFERGKLFRLNWGLILQTGKRLNVCEEKSVCALMAGYRCNWWGWFGQTCHTDDLLSLGEWELSGDRWLAHLLHSLLGH